jgi:glycosyltransferase involved in cell wall biosynthesis
VRENKKSLSLAFVTPRYGRDVVGGSEAVMAEAAHGLAQRGHKVEILTTCAKSHFSWANEFPEEVFTDVDLAVRRFKTVTKKRRLAVARIETRLSAGEALTATAQDIWLNERFRAPGPYLYLLSQHKRYDAVVFSPYLFWSTLACAGVVGEKSVIMPCLHDEPYARLGIVKKTLSEAALLWFLSEPEHQLCHRVAPEMSPLHEVTGAAVAMPDSYNPSQFVEKHGLKNPFLLYVGRREEGKGWNSLLKSFATALATQRFKMDLVTIGVGSVNIPDSLKNHVIDLGYLDAKELPDAFAAASALAQPSTNESFSRTIMEAWLAKTPVIAYSGGEVATWHCERSKGGMTYADNYELTECLQLISSNKALAAQMGENGRSYVLSNYTWDKVVDKMEDSLRNLSNVNQLAYGA